MNIFWEEKHLFYTCILYCNNAWELREAFRLRQLAAPPGYGESFIVELIICLASKQGGEKNPHNILQSHHLITSASPSNTWLKYCLTLSAVRCLSNTGYISSLRLTTPMLQWFPLSPDRVYAISSILQINISSYHIFLNENSGLHSTVKSFWPSLGRLYCRERRIPQPTQKGCSV